MPRAAASEPSIQIERWLADANRRAAAYRFFSALPWAAFAAGAVAAAEGARRAAAGEELTLQFLAGSAAWIGGGAVLVAAAAAVLRARGFDAARRADLALSSGDLVGTGASLAAKTARAPLEELCVRSAARRLALSRPADLYPLAPRASLSAATVVACWMLMILLCMALRLAFGVLPLIPGTRPGGGPQSPAASKPDEKHHDDPRAASTPAPLRPKPQPESAPSPAAAQQEQQPQPQPAPVPAPTPQPPPPSHAPDQRPDAEPENKLDPKIDRKVVPLEADGDHRRNRPSTVLEIVQGDAAAARARTAPRSVEVTPESLEPLKRAAEKAMAAERLMEKEKKLAKSYFDALKP